MPDTLRVLLLFSDDSTLIFAHKMRDLLYKAQAHVQVQMAGYTPEDALSERQLLQYLPDCNYIPLSAADLSEAALSGEYDAILTSRVYRPLSVLLKTTILKHSRTRAKVIAFLGGLDFFPDKGLAHRKNCDGVFLFPQSRIQDMADLRPQDDPRPIGFGHPSFLHPAPDAAPKGRDIYFFTQAISPNTKRARLHVLKAICAIAKRNPTRQVWIKLRHLPDENTAHLHREKYNYATLLESLPTPPPNLGITACTMDEALDTAGLGITCTSTAAIDLIRMGIPTMVYLDYVDNYCDPLVAPMAGLFDGSGLISSLNDLLHLNHSPPNPAWMNQILCPANLGDQVVRMIRDL